MTQLSRSLSNLSLVLRDKNDSSLQSLKSANFEFSLMRKCFSCSQIHVLNGNSRKTKRNSINRAFSSDHINTNITTKLLKMIDLNAQQKCKLKFGFNNSVDMIPEISKDLENLDSESNDFIHSYRDFDQNNLDYEIYNKSNDNNDCLVSEELLSASRSVCDGLSPVDVSPSGYYSCELSQSVEGENWKFNSCENIDIKTEKNLSNLSECSSGITLTEEVTNYDKSNHQKSRSYR
jgi:activator of HSP90 ATPase